MPAWLLLDYGQVLSTAPPADGWEALRQTAGGAEPALFGDIYWEHRPHYDRGDLTAAEYWERVLGSPPSPARLDELVQRDVAVWLHPDQATVDAAGRARARGWRLAIFSNAPVEVAAGIDALDWLEPFERRFYSCHLRAIKPEPDAYRQVVDGLGTSADDIVFFDDRPPNVEAAAALGFQAHLFTAAAQLDAVHPRTP